ncbi:MAG: sigma 54-interacting transcriptional regulator [Gemmatimonadota bacterium]
MPPPALADLDAESLAALRAIGTPGASEKQGGPSPAAQRAMGHRLYAHGHYAAAELCLRGVWQGGQRDGNDELTFAAGLDLTRSLVNRSPREALGLLHLLASVDGAARDRATVFNLLGAAFLERYELPLADRNFLRALEAATEQGDDLSLAYIEANRACTLFELRRMDEAARLHRAALERLDALGEAGNAGLVLCNMAIHAMLQGRYDDALRAVERGRAQLGASDNLWLAAMLDFAQAELALATDERAAGLEHLIDAGRRSALAGLPGVQAKSLIWRAILERGATDPGLPPDIQGAAVDLDARDLRNDSGAVWLLAVSLAERMGEATDRPAAAARSVYGRDAEGSLLARHYGRLLAGLAGPSRRRAPAPFPQFLTQAPVVLAAKERLQRLVDTDVRLLFEGPSGTGKSFLARLVHEAGRRRGAPFILVDCTNLEENLFESKLFGHVRGAFTGAVSDAVGLIEQANGGTLFLDEIGELPPEIQAKLLYTIEEQRYRPVGGRAEKRAEFRVVAATNRNIDAMLAAGTLRSDLFYRLAGYRIWLPPLRERREDIVPLIERRLAELNQRYGRSKSLRYDVWVTLAQYGWPGNVRELNATLERGFHLALGRRIGIEDLGLGLSPTGEDTADLSWYTVRRVHLLRILRACRGNVTRAARILGLQRTTLIYKLKLLDIERADFAPGGAVEPFPEAMPRRVADRVDEPPGPAAPGD